MIAICIIGIPKFYKLTYNSIIKNLTQFYKEEIKFFLNISLSEDIKNNTNFNFNVDDIIKCYNPEKYIITTKYHKIYDEIQNDYQKYTNSAYNNYVNIANSLKLVEEYENEKQKKFLYILKLRFDLYIIKPLHISSGRNILYVEYHNKAKNKFVWSTLIDNIVGQNFDLIYSNYSLTDYTDYIPDLVYYGYRDTIMKLIEIPELFVEQYKKFDIFKYSDKLITWFSFPEKTLLFYTMINNIIIETFGQGYTSLLHTTNNHSIKYYNELFKINFSEYKNKINLAGELII